MQFQSCSYVFITVEWTARDIVNGFQIGVVPIKPGGVEHLEQEVHDVQAKFSYSQHMG